MNQTSLNATVGLINNHNYNILLGIFRDSFIEGGNSDELGGAI